MSEVVPASPEEQIATLQAEVARLQVPKPSPLSGVSTFAKKIGKGFWAAVASTEAVKQEKSLAALIILRVLISVGAADGTVKLVQALLSLAGVK